MKFCYFVLAAAIALLAGSNDVAGASSEHKITASSVRALTAEEESAVRHLRVDGSDDKKNDENTQDEEEKGLFDWLVGRYAAKRQYRRWYRSRLTPKEVNQLLKSREAEGRYVDWDLAAGYEKYYGRRRHNIFYD